MLVKVPNARQAPEDIAAVLNPALSGPLFDEDFDLTTNPLYSPLQVWEEDEDENEVTVYLVISARYLWEFDDSCFILARWPGKTRSDYFLLTVGDFKRSRPHEPRYVRVEGGA